MTVATTGAQFTSTVDGTTHYFCSVGCRREFLAAKGVT